jgi:glycosyltransferase involved in cell wall biosynthesis
MSAFNLELYVSSENEPFSEGRVVRKPVELRFSSTEHTLMGPLCEEPVNALRIDFGDGPSEFLLLTLNAVTAEGETIFSWDGEVDLFETAVGIRATATPSGVLVECLTDDPQLLIPVPDNEALQVGIQFSALAHLAEHSGAPDLEALNEGQAELARAVRAVDETTRRLLDQVLIEQNEISRGLLEARNASRNLGDNLGFRFSQALEAIQALEATQAGVRDLQQRIVDRDERETGRNASLEGSLVARVEAAEDAVLNRIGSLEASSDARFEGYIGSAQEALHGLIETVTARLELQNRSSEYRASEQLIEITGAITSQGHATVADLAAREDLTLQEISLTRSVLLSQASATEKRLQDIEAALVDRSLLDRIKAELGCSDLPASSVLSEIHRLKAEAHHQQSVAHELITSTSWKITRPVRVFKRLLTTGRLRAPRSSSSRPVEPGPSDGDGSSKNASAHWSALPATYGQAASKEPTVRLIAFYLPQFHAIPENDEWWGKGFTEWTNVRRAEPQFVGHEQPHVPADLGYYDLNDPDVQVRQARLAAEYGLGGFCFYFYWFGGKRLLEMPISTFANNPDITLPFCLCWANENWSRRWDGKDSEILIAQDHSADDDIAFIEHLSQYLRNPRYIRVDGKPLVMVYRPGLLPDPRGTAARWRHWCRNNGVGEIHLAYTQSFEAVDPAEYGFDAAIEFPPNNTAPPVITDSVDKLNPAFSGIVYDYRTYPARSEAYVTPPYTLYRGVFPAWDNEARRTGRGAVFHHSSPALYRTWLRNAAIDTERRFVRPDSRLVFVNAWNEWAEGAHLEPDQRYGYAYLQATRAALSDARNRSKLVLVTHDAYRHGAQYLALNLARVLCERHDLDLRIVVLGDGPMISDFALYGTVFNLSGVDPLGSDAQDLARRFRREGVIGAICNTTVSGHFLTTLSGAGVRCIALIHEMQALIRDSGLTEQAEAIVRHADRLVFPSTVVEESFASVVQPPVDRVTIRPQGLYKRNANQSLEAKQAARERLRAHLNLSPESKIVLGVGYGDRRKGLDLFIEIGAIMMGGGADVVFVWVGDIAVELARDASAAITASGNASRFKLMGFQAATDDFYAGADAYALTSREDPFPTVVMEALDVSVPVVAFEGVGGSVELLHDGCGLVASAGDTAGFAAQIARLFAEPSTARALGDTGKQRVDFDFSFPRYVDDLKAMLDPGDLRVSVVVPNYNYARYLPARLSSIEGQHRHPYEIILLDDASTDDSLAVIDTLRPSIKTPINLVRNGENSGSVFRQWLRGVEACSGDLVWIAEADDLADPAFLQTVCKAFDDPAVVMSFCQSKQMDAHGRVLCDHYLDYVSDIGATQWTKPYVASGQEEVRLRLAVKNTIPNVSAVVFRKSALLACLREAIDDIAAYRNAGDWVAYVKLLRTGKIAFDPRSLNLHRRHEQSVTLAAFNEQQLREILKVQQWVAKEFDVPRGVAKIATAYAEDLYARFGLATEPGMSLKIDPRLSSFLTRT